MTLAEFAAELDATARGITKESAGVVAKGALNVKTEARRNATASSGVHARKYPGTITYDVDPNNGLTAEIGPERRGQGHLGPILEYGSINNPPHRDLSRALDAEEARFIKAASEIGLL
jgi:hypothetical protein